jgi:hypothetical protein
VIGSNPFVVPGLEDYPDQPLCPWQDGLPHHEDYYGKVGGQHEAYELFKQRLRQPESLHRASRIIVVTGPELSGKTSLANRCVNWVRVGLGEQTRCHVYPLREVCPRGETVKERVAMVCVRLTEKLRELDNGSSKSLSNLFAAHEVLPLFGRFHASTENPQYFVILLPSLEPDTAEKEIDQYRAALSGVPGVLCVTENPTDTPFPESRGEAPPISLNLRYLRPGESHTLVAGWPNTPKEGKGVPIIRETDLNKLERLLEAMNVNMTSGKLLNALRKVYDSLDNPGNGDHQAAELSYIEYAELIEAYLGKWLRQQNPQGSV